MTTDLERWASAAPSRVTYAIQVAAQRYSVPAVLMYALASCEDPAGIAEARGDRGILAPCCSGQAECGPDADGYCSFGIFQFQRCCNGLGVGQRIADLLNPEYNANLAASIIRSEHDARGNWYAALWPWSCRDVAWQRATGGATHDWQPGPQAATEIPVVQDTGGGSGGAPASTGLDAQSVLLMAGLAFVVLGLLSE